MKFIHLPMKMESTVRSETSAIKTQTWGNYSKRKKLHLEHGESLKTRYLRLVLILSSFLCIVLHTAFFPAVSRPKSSIILFCFLSVLYAPAGRHLTVAITVLQGHSSHFCKKKKEKKNKTKPNILSVEHNLHCSGANPATCFGSQKDIVRLSSHKYTDKMTQLQSIGTQD